MEKSYIGYLLDTDITSALAFKVLLLLTTGTYTQTQIGDRLDLHKQNTSKHIGVLLELGLIEVVKTEGKNKFYKAITNIDRLKNYIPGQTKMFNCTK